MYWKWDHDTILFTKSELQRLHLHFYHPSVRKQYNLIRRAKQHEATSDTREFLEEITEDCKTCQHISKRPYHFRVSMPEDIIFNQDLALDLMWLDCQRYVTYRRYADTLFFRSYSKTPNCRGGMVCFS
jgi:hypothetical protein